MIGTADTLDGQREMRELDKAGPGLHPYLAPGWGGGTDLAIGTAAPAPSFIWAAGLVIMTEASSSTCHIPHMHSRAEDQASSRVGRIHFLLTGSGLHIAGVPSWAAMLAILTAHGLG